MRKKGRGNIVKVGDLFEHYRKRLAPPQGIVIKTFQEVIEDMFGFAIRAEQCSYTVKTQTLALTVPGPLKSEILLRKEEILAHLRARLGEKGSPRTLL